MFVPTAVLALAAGLVAAPATTYAADDPQRVANLDSRHPSVDKPVPNGTGRAVLTPYPRAGKICYRFTYEDMEVRALTLNRRATDAQVALFYDEAPLSPASGCTTIGKSYFDELTSSRVREITQHPRRFYVRASTYSGYEIAGNLHRPGQ